MSRLRLGLLITTLLACLGGVLPASAAERVAPPTLAQVRSIRAQLYVSFNDRPLLVCHQEYIGTNRFHEVCQQLANVPEQAIPEPDFPWTAGTLKEFVYYDGISYTRLNAETTWTAEADPDYNPNPPSIVAAYTYAPAAVLSNLGQLSFGGKTVTHYQYWTTDKAANQEHHGQAVYDQYVSADGYVLHDQSNYYGDFPGLGSGHFSAIWTYTDHNSDAIRIGPPPADRVKATAGT